MIQGKFHTEINEVTYIREELEEIYNQHISTPDKIA